MRFTLTTSLVAVLLAAGAGSAAARPEPLRYREAADHAAAMQSLAIHRHELNGNVAAPAPVVRKANPPEAGNGIDWADVGIGSGLAAAVLLSAAGVSSLRRHPNTTVRS
jgi:hypothetical protein